MKDSQITTDAAGASSRAAHGSPLRSMRESLDKNPPTMEEAKLLLKNLRWDVDMVITNYDGERVWLGSCLNAEGKRIGITDCCLESAPCDHHRKMANAKLCEHGGPLASENKGGVNPP